MIFPLSKRLIIQTKKKKKKKEKKKRQKVLLDVGNLSGENICL